MRHYKKSYKSNPENTIIKKILGVAGGICFIDFAGFCAWVISGQLPASEFYIGRLTVELLKLILK